MRGALAVLLLGACGHAAGPTPTSIDGFADDPIATLAGLEDRLTKAAQIDVTLTARAIGPFNLELAGELHIERERVSWIKLRGDSEGTPVTGKWSSKTPVDPTLADTQPPTWADSLLIGLTRMGALHNFAMVMGNADPDTGNGDVRSWIAVSEEAWKDGEPSTRVLVFRIDVVGGTDAEIELTLDERGLPVRRDQVVHFAEGDMRVFEEYARFDVKP